MGKDKNEKIIMTVERPKLFGEDYFQGFVPAGNLDYESRILQNYQWTKRGPAETNPELKQPIAYSMVVNPTLKQVFSYQRAKKDKDYGEKRLQGKWAWGVGGHIEKLDASGKNPIHDSMLRELREEVDIQGSINPRVIGYINDDADSVGQVHFGVLYVIATDAKIVNPKDAEIAEGRLRTIPELEQICLSPECQVEGWSKIVFEQLKSWLI